MVKKVPKDTVKAAKPASEPKVEKTFLWFKRSKQTNLHGLPGAFRMFGGALHMLVKHWKVFLGIIAIYGFLNLLLVQGFHLVGGLGDVKSSLGELFSGNWGQLLSGVALFVYLMGVSGNTASSSAGAYQFLLGLLVSLALIWALRQLYAGHALRVRDAFYRGTAPLIQFVLVLLVVAIQLLPLSVGFLLYGTVMSNGIATTGIEQIFWTMLLAGLSALSLYLISSSAFALYIITLPDMTPMRALRSAKELVRFRRWAVLRKLLFLPLAIIVASGALTIPLIMYATPVAPWAFFAVSLSTLPILHSYMYRLYRALL